MTIYNQEKEWEENNVEGDPDEDDDDDDDDDEEDEEDIVDPLNALRDDCAAKASCAAYQLRLDTCNDRVNSRSKTEEDCTEELFDFLHCRDHCVAQSLFKQLK